MANTLALTALSVTLGLLFIFIGTIKLSPAVSEELHKEMKTTFKNARQVFPFFKQTGWRPKTSEYRRAVGTTELVCGVLLALIPGARIKLLANLILMMVMGGAIYTHWALGDEMKHYTGALVFGLLLTCRLAIYMQPRQEVVVRVKKE